MGSSPDNSTGAGDKKPLDLSQLEGLNFGPSWMERKGSDAPKVKERTSRGGSGGPAKDRRRGRPDRKSGPPASSSHQAEGQSAGAQARGDRRSPRRDRQTPPREDFKPIVDVTFYPEDIPFKALSHAMKTNCRTYELFEIARLILEKPDRFVVVLHPSKGEDGTLPQQFYQSVIDGVPFLSEEAVIAHVLKHHINNFFSVEEIEAEPPKGNFVTVGKCGITGDLLGPPNYHRYQALLQEHHSSRVPNMAFERFVSKIEQIKDPEVVNEWLSKMTKINRYQLLEPKEGDPETLDGVEAARLFLLSRRREAVIRVSDNARFSGKNVDALPRGDLRRSVESMLEQQRRFPLETANNLRGRLRRMRFTIYKKGSKGVSYVCAVKRNFRQPGTNLSDSVQAVIEFIETNPGVKLGDLPDKYLGIKPQETVIKEQEKAPDIEEVPREQAEAIVEEHELRRQERFAEQRKNQADVTSPAPTQEQPDAETASESKAEAPAPVAGTEQASVEAPKAQEASPIDDPRIRQLMIDLHWLVHEGFVVELGDGTLFAVPYLQQTSKDQPEETHTESESKLDQVTSPSDLAIEASAVETVEQSAIEPAEVESKAPEVTEPKSET